ncbi:MAG: hypothetical protein ACYDC6_12380 [Acidobacteriaceae bacterium]
MQRILMLGMTLMLLSGCALQKPATAAAPLPPGITSTYVEDTNSTLMSIHASLNAGEAYLAAHSGTLSAAITADFNLLVDAANIADATFVSYQQGAATQAQMTAALANATAQQTKLFADTTGGVK